VSEVERVNRALPFAHWELVAAVHPNRLEAIEVNRRYLRPREQNAEFLKRHSAPASDVATVKTWSSGNRET
jgi:hypothetical protein